MPYIAPEVLTGKYRAIPADLWSCGIILVAMLTGGEYNIDCFIRHPAKSQNSSELPWDQPSQQSSEYARWVKDDYLTITPWKKMDNQALSLAKKILNPDAKERLSVEKIICQPWMQTVFDHEGEGFVGFSGFFKAGVVALAI